MLNSRTTYRVAADLGITYYILKRDDSVITQTDRHRTLANSTGLEAVGKLYFAPPPGGSRWIEASPAPELSAKTETYLFAEWPDMSRAARELGDKESSDLFLKFAQLDPTKDSILAFADTYGWLGVERDLVVDRSICSGEPFKVWIAEIHSMRAAADLAAAIAGNDLKLLKTWLTFYDDEGFLKFRNQSEHGIATWKVTPQSAISQSVRKKQWGRAGNIILHEMINKRLTRNSGVGVTFDARRNQLTVQVRIGTLLTGMWLQLANHVARGQIVHCEACLELMILERSNKRMCGEACRSLLYRRRKKQPATKKEKRK